MNPLGMNPLDLRDIHPPAGYYSWPPAPGWWLLLLLWGLLILALWLGQRYRRARLHRRLARRELVRMQRRWQEEQNHQALVQECSQLIRRALLACLPAGEIAALSGEPWRQRLNSLVGRPLFNPELALLVTEDLYRPWNDEKAASIPALLSACDQLFRSLPPVPAPRRRRPAGR